MSSRAATAASNRRVKQELVRLLFGKESSASTTTTKLTPKEFVCRSQTLDYAQYSYRDLRVAYLERLHALHPDKTKHNSASSLDDNNATTYVSGHDSFVELQEAWDRYDQAAKMAQTVDADSVHKERNFTLFGVGCSFSDNDQEREWRSEITDQACRGWFSSGLIEEETASCSNQQGLPQNGQQTDGNIHTPLLDHDDEMFVIVDDEKLNNADADTQNEPAQIASWRTVSYNNKQATTKKTKSLVDRRFGPRSVGSTVIEN